MRLLHTSHLKMKEFINDREIPRYAILSHTWGEEEVTLQQWQNLPEVTLQQWQNLPLDQLVLSSGYSKILRCCEQARRESLEWAWIDTCCIDKTSSAELSEAINSMFRWYSDSVVCYAFLADVPKDVDVQDEGSTFSESRWFTRGWTLQELIAPSNFVFFSRDWSPLGTKSELHGIVTRITGIEKKYLDRNNLYMASTAKRMFWASGRETSRTEDIAYSLLGIFDINMALIYGEGKKAFKRLQEEIIKTRGADHSLFAWGTTVEKPSNKIDSLDEYLDLENSVDQTADGVERGSIDEPLLGLLSESPHDFATSADLIAMPGWRDRYEKDMRHELLPVTSADGIRLRLPLIYLFHAKIPWNNPHVVQLRQGCAVCLFCCFESDHNTAIALPIRLHGSPLNGRTRERLRTSASRLVASPMEWLCFAAERKRALEHGDVLVRTYISGSSSQCQSNFSMWSAFENFHSGRIIRAAFLQSAARPGFVHFIDRNLSTEHGFCIVIGRSDTLGTHNDSLVIQIFPRMLVKRGAQKPNRVWDQTMSNPINLQWTFHMEPLPKEPVAEHIMAPPRDIWHLHVEPFPRMSFRVERMPLAEHGSFIDALDIVIPPKYKSESLVHS